LLKLGKVDRIRRHLSVITFSTGVNLATGLFEGPLSLAREMGHIRVGTDSNTNAGDIVQNVSSYIGKPASIEDLLSGSKGIPNLVAAAYSYRFTDLRTEREIADARLAGRLGQAMTEGAIRAADYWTDLATDFAELLGLALNQLVVGELVSELFIQGSVVNGTPGFAEWLFSDATDLVANLISDGMEKSHVAKDVQVWGVPEEASMAALGAQQYAASLALAA
jgi:hypothetical protein